MGVEKPLPRDDELLSAWLDGRSEASFRELVARHAGLVYGACRRRLGGDPHLAEDAAQAVFLILARKAASLRGRRSLGGWLLKVSHHVVSHMVREAGRRRRREEVAMRERARAARVEATWKEIRERLDEILMDLSPALREPLVMCYLEHRTAVDAARVLGCTENAVRKRLAVALLELRRRLLRAGVSAAPAVLVACLSGPAAEAAPATAAAWGSASAEGPVPAIAQGALRLMAWAKVKAAAAVLGATLAVAAGVGVAASQFAPAPLGPKVQRDPSGPLNDRTFWLGNSFRGGDRQKGKWVPLDIDDIFVFPDGRVVANCGWDEGGRAIGFYRDGDVAGKVDDYTALTGGIAVAADEQYLFALRTERKLGESDPMWHGVARYTLEGKPAKWPQAEGRVRNVLFLHPPTDKGGRPLTGVAARGGELFLSDPQSRSVKIFGTSDMAPRREFKLDPETDVPLKMVFDRAGRLWIGQRSPGNGFRVRAYDIQGKYLGVEVADAGEPAGLAVDGAGHLVVADNGPRQQVRFYDVSSRPVLKKTFGVEGGAYAGPTPGLSGPDRFCGLTGVGFDREGNLYVSTNGRGPYGDDNGFGAQLRKFDRSGKLLWMLEGLEFLDTADADPGDDRQVFTKDSRYEIEYGKATGEGWPHGGWAHRAWTVHRFKYPNDPRLHIRQEGVRVVRLRDGRRLLGCQWDGHLAVYRFDGEIAVPAAVFSRHGSGRDKWPPNNPFEDRAWMWADANGDGEFQAGEFGALAERGIDVMRAWQLDDEGAAWIGEQKGTIHRFPIQKSGPMYSVATRTLMKAPAGITHVRFMRYVPASDTMYLATYSKDHPMETWYPMAREIRRYDRWSKEPSPAWTIVLPYRFTNNRPRDIQPISFDAAGDYVFVAFDWGSDEKRRNGEIVVYKASDGSRVGSFWVGPEVGGRSGCIDFGSAIRARKRADGTYVVFAEEVEFAKIVYYLWKP